MQSQEKHWAQDWNHCQECGTTDIPHHARGLCENCYARGRDRTNRCLDCGAVISRRATRCCSCAVKRRWERGDLDHVHSDDGFRRKQSEAIKAAHQKGVYGDEWRQKKSKAMRDAYEYGELFSEEHRRKLSEAMRARWASGDMDGVFDEEWRHKQSRATKAMWERGVFDEEWHRKQSKATQAAWRRGAYDGVFQSPTSIELKVAAALDIMGIEHTPQYRPPNYGRTFDEFVPPRTLIEINGDYWHSDSCPDNQRRDAEKKKWAIDNGYDFLVIWEHEIKEYGAWAIVAEMFEEVQNACNN